MAARAGAASDMSELDANNISVTPLPLQSSGAAAAQVLCG
jgi:hypothetical protein